MKTKWYENTIVIVIFLILFFPVGLFLMWRYSRWNKVVKWIITGILILLMFGSLLSSGSSTSTVSQSVINTDQQITQTLNTDDTNTLTPYPESPTYEVVPTTTPAKQINTQVNTPSPSETISQTNAVKKAKSYLNYSAFSHDGLVAQLEYEQFSHTDAVYGADHSDANWNDQAAKKAKSYMEYSAFSRGSLIQQLKFDKFTQQQAEYGANSVGL